jgi:hypothetical protein
MLEAAAKMRQAAVDAHIPAVAKALNDFYRNRPDFRTISVSEEDAFAQKIVAELRQILDWGAIAKICEYHNYDLEDWENDDDEENKIDLLSLRAAASTLYRRETRNEYYRQYRADPHVKEALRKRNQQAYKRKKAAQSSVEHGADDR